MSKKTFTIFIECDVNLSVVEIWPDGDAPENPTAADVIKTMEDNYSSVEQMLGDWNLPVEVHVWDANNNNDRKSWR